MGKTITSELTKTVTIGVAGYTSPLTVSASGSVEPAAAGSDGILLPAGAGPAVIVNDGFIIAAKTTLGTYSIGVDLKAAATLTNTAIIQGGAGGVYNPSEIIDDGENGGAGVIGGAGVTVNNATGLIVGGAGGYGMNRQGVGGDGVVLDGAGSMLINTNNGGFLAGIVGGAGPSGSYYANGGGAGVSLLGGAYASNASFITGGAGGAIVRNSVPPAGAGGDGAEMSDSSVNNLAAGRITGGAGGNAQMYAVSPGAGGAGVAVQSLNGTASILVNHGAITGGAGGSLKDSDYGGSGAEGGDGVTLSGSGAYFANYGTVMGGIGGAGVLVSTVPHDAGAGGFGVYLKDGAAGRNFGGITAGAGGTGADGVAGVTGVDLVTGVFYNFGIINGGAGGVTSMGVTLAGGAGASDIAGYFYNIGGKIFGAKGGYGLMAEGNTDGYAAAATVANSGTITGGNGAGGLFAAYAAYIRNSGTLLGGDGAGIGASLTGDAKGTPTLVNSGVIQGGAAYQSAPAPQAGGLGAMVQAATLINSGTIIGGAGGFGQNSMLETGQGGGGVLIVDALVIDSGRIAGGAAGQGPAGYAVSFLSSGTLELTTGAVIAGEVEGDAGFADVLEFSGSGSFGSGFTGMTDISFATGAAWTVAGDAANLAGGQQISGFAAGSFIVLDDVTNDAAPGFSGGTLALTDTVSNTALAMTFATALTGDLLVKAGGGNTTLSLVPVTSGITLAAGVDEVVLTGGTATKLTVDAGAAVTVADGGQLTGATVKGVLQVLSGGAATDVSVATNAILTVSGGEVENTTIAASGGAYFTGGVASNTTLAGGYMELSAGAQLSGTFDFKGKGGILQVEDAPLPTVVISGFGAGDQIILDDTAFAGGKVKVTANGELTISEGGKSYELDIAGAKKGSTDYVFANHTLTEKPAKMAFARPVAGAATEAAGLPHLLTAGGFQAMAAAGPISASASAYGGFVFEPLQVPNGGIQMMVTLQS